LSALPLDKFELNAATALATDDVRIARGHQTARWDGQRWQRYDLPRRRIAIMALSALSPRNVWGGRVARVLPSRGPAIHAGRGPLIIHWDGTRWHAVASPMAATAP
jgi:hypothetical protein